MGLRAQSIGALAALAAFAGIGPVAGATPTETDAPARRAARVEAPFVPAGELDEVPGFTMKMRGERRVLPLRAQAGHPDPD